MTRIGPGAARVLLAAAGVGAEGALPQHVVAGLAVAVVAVVAIAGIMSGLTLGLLSLDRLDLELMLRTGNRRQHARARRLLPLVAHPHWVLSTLVICNTAASMALPLALDRLVNVAVALVLSTTAIVIFGEILPQAVCSRHGLAIGGAAAPAVRVLMWLTAPISWPIGRALDVLLGREGFTLRHKREIRAFVDLHRESAGMGGPLNEEEAQAIRGVLDLGRKKGNRAMTPLDKVFMLSTDDVLDRPTLLRILGSGHSRLPVYRGTDRLDIVGLVLVKELLGAVGLAPPGVPPASVSTLGLRHLPTLPADTPMADLLNLFQTGHSHMAVLVERPGPDGRTSSAVGGGAGGGGGGGGSIRGVSSVGGGSDGAWHVGSASEPRSHSGSGYGSSRSSLSDGSSSSSGDGTTHRSDRSDGGSPRSHRSGARAAERVRSLLTCLSASKRSRRQQARSAGGSTTGCVAPKLAPAQPQLEQQQQQQKQHKGQPLNNVEAAVTPRDTAGIPPQAAAPAPSPAPSPALLSAAAIAAAAAAGGGLGPVPLVSTSVGAALEAVEGCVPVGIITLEDVIEELMQEEIVDETDAFIDNEQKVKVNARVLAGTLPASMRRLVLASQLSQRMVHAQQGGAGSALQPVLGLPQAMPPSLRGGSGSSGLRGGSGSSSVSNGAVVQSVAPADTLYPVPVDVNGAPPGQQQHRSSGAAAS